MAGRNCFSMSTPAVSLRADLPPVDSNLHAHAYARAYEVCVAKVRRNIVRLADRPLAGAWATDGNYFENPEGFFAIGNWTSSFFTGMALLAFEHSGDRHFLQQVNRLADLYRDKITRHRMDTMHDLGFLYSLYSVGLHRITGDLEHRRTGLIAADELAKRFSPKGHYLQAWGRMDEPATDYTGLAIIDSMMNLPLLFWAAREAGSRFYAEIATAHANTTQACFVRPDDSVCHAFRFDLRTGAATRPDNYCGLAVDSHWARGTAWAIYGFALAYRNTRDALYLETATRLARRFVARLDEEVVPVWDFALEDGQPRLRDSSAAAIAVCGFDEICSHQPDSILSTAGTRLLNRLCTPPYLDVSTDCPAVLRQGEVGDGIGKAKSVCTSWGDYFFMEALARRLHGTIAYW
jgi:unsaturated chondroitin disaccharide hydrolase